MLGYMSYKGILNVAFNNVSVKDRVGQLYWFGKLRKNRNSPTNFTTFRQ